MSVFASIFELINSGILASLSGHATGVINLISPIIGISFTIYLLLIATQAMRGNVGGENIMDFFYRSIGWVAIITFGLNIEYYNKIVAIVNELGPSISSATGTEYSLNPGAMLDTVAGKYIGTTKAIWDQVGTIQKPIAIFVIVIFLLSGAMVVSIAAAYILLAQIALGVLLVIGPIFISLAMFPATRKFFDAWVGQVVNYILLVILFNFLLTILADLVKDLLKYVDGGLTGMVQLFGLAFVAVDLAILWVLVSFNMPSLASSLAGGVGISSMVSKPLQAAKGLAGLFKGKNTPSPPKPNEIGQK